MEQLVQFSLISRLSSGNIFIDSIMGSILIAAYPYINFYLKFFYEKLKDILKLGFVKDNSIQLKGTVTRDRYKTDYNFSKALQSLFWYIKINMGNIDGISKLVEITTSREKVWDDMDNSHVNSDTNLVINQDREFKISDDIYAIIDVYDREGENNDSKGVQKLNEIIVTIYSLDNVLKVKNFLDDIMIQYDEHIQDSMAKNQLYFTMEDEEKLTYSEYIFDCNTTFDTIFFDKKDEVKKELDFFINNKQFYEEKGLPYRYGMLLHGMPGCGKTSLIKAIAKYTGRHIVNINVNLIKDKKMLEDIFYNTKINKYSMTNDKKLYVIEEFDVNAIDLIKDRNIDYDLNKKTKDGYIKNINNSAEEVSEEDTEKMLEAFKVTDDKVEMSLEHFRKIQTVSMVPPKKGMTLGDLLQVLDGLIECSGRMLIVTTNDFLKIDKALLRAGRIDKMVEFNRLNSNELIKLYRFFVNSPSKIVEKYIMDESDDIIEAAEFVSICRNNLNNNEGLLKSLKNYILSK